MANLRSLFPDGIDVHDAAVFGSGQVQHISTAIDRGNRQQTPDLFLLVAYIMCFLYWIASICIHICFSSAGSIL